MDKIKEFILGQAAEKKLPKEEAISLLQEISDYEINHEKKTKGDIAIVGMACRFPEANSYVEFWNNLVNEVDAIDFFPENRIEDVSLVNKEAFTLLRNAKYRPGGFLKRIDQFDPAFFNITPTEAKYLDPNHRFFLEVAWEAIEDAGYTREQINGTNTGVFVGHSMENLYKRLVGNNDPNADLGNLPALIGARLSYLFNLKGPSMTVDTTCSSSLVAVHNACQALQAGDCNLSIVGGVNIGVLPLWTGELTMGHEAEDGRCKSFDASANGTNVAEGVGVVLLKKLEDAIQDKDQILAVIKGTAVNSDGYSNGITAPNPEAQTNVIKSAWKNAGIDPETISYIESHGTGTKLGDPIEIKGLTEAFRQFTDQKQFVDIGSLKTNIGHLDAAAGIASLVKTVLCLKHKKIPASLHFETPNPLIDFKNSPVTVVNALKEWEPASGIRRAGISSFGMSGTNCHVIVEEYAEGFVEEEKYTQTEVSVFTLSAKSKRSLFSLVRKYKDWLDGDVSAYSYGNVLYTANCLRGQYQHRLAIHASSLQELRQKLNRVSAINEVGQIPNLTKEGIFYSNCDSGKSGVIENQERALRFDDPQDVIDAFMAGVEIDWKGYYQDKPYKKVTLPTYAFDRSRYWPKLEMAEGSLSNDTSIDSFLYDLEWEESPRPVVEEVKKSNELWLVFANDSELSKELVTKLRESEREVVLVRPSKSFDQVTRWEYYINPTASEDYCTLLNGLSTDLPRLAGIIHMWTCEEEEWGFDNLATIATSQNLGVYSAFLLTKALLTYDIKQNLQFTVITDYANRINGSERMIDPTKATLQGFVKVISQEWPKVSTYTIDVDTYGMSCKRIVDEVCAEIRLERGSRAELVAYRENKRYIQKLRKFNSTAVKPRVRGIKQGGVYVIAGAGYLGMETAKFMAQQQPIKLVILNRKPLPPREQWAEILRKEDENSRLYKQLNEILNIEKLGSEVLFIQTDVTNQKNVADAIEMIKNRFGKIDGVLFAVKQISAKSIQDISEEEFHQSIESKVYGAWLLDHYTKEFDLDFFINFASISSIMAGPYNCDCTAVNTFLDSFGDYRMSLGRETVTLNLTEIFTGDKVGNNLEVTMIPAIDYEDYLKCLGYVFKHDIPYIVISYFDWEIMSIVLPMMKITFDQELLEMIHSDSQESPTTILPQKTLPPINLDREGVYELLKDIWKEVLGYEEFQSFSNFFDLGGTSLSAVKLLRLITERMSIKFEVANLYTYPTFDAMANYICQQVGEQESDELLDMLEGLENEDMSVADAMRMLEDMEVK